MAQFLDERPDEELNENEELAQFEDEESTLPEEDAPVAEEEVVEEPEDDLPEKYRGKTKAEIAQMHREAEKLLGRQSSEVGELRKAFDEFAQAQLVTQKAPSPQQETVEDDIDFFEDPKRAVTQNVEQLLANHPALKQVQELNQSLTAQQTMSRIKENHPDAQEIAQNEAFQEWVKSSRIRTELYKRADENFDFDAADELFSTWKDRQKAVAQTAEVGKEDRKRQVKAASTGSAQGSGEVSRKIYRRADLRNLMIKDPERYLALSEEIQKAYAEGRVK